jgi:diguanylate cyclase (GGDEF)-like protein/PAS domain S-box-containing protein
MVNNKFFKALYPMKISLIYSLVGCIWFLFSDRMINLFVQEPVLMNRLQAGKNWFFVLITSGFLYHFLSRGMSRLLHSEKTVQLHETLLGQMEYKVLTAQPLEEEILPFLTEQLVNTLGYASALIGITEPDGSASLRASAGVFDNSQNRLEIRWDDTPLGQGSFGQCIRTGKNQAYNIQGNPRFRAWAALFERLNIHSVMALPLLIQGQPIGALVLFSRQPNFFDASRGSQLEHFAFQVAIAYTTARLKAHLERYHLLYEHSRDILLFLHPDGQIIDANLAATLTYGYSREELLSLRVHDLRTAETLSTLHTQLQDACSEGILFETIHRRKDGTPFPVEVNSLGASLNGVNVLLSIVRDTTERKQTQAALQLSEMRYREMFENMSNAVAVYGVLDSGKSFIFKEFNRAAEKIEKISRENVLGKSPLDVFPNLKEFGLINVFSRVWQTGKPESFPTSFYQDHRIMGWRDYYIYKLNSGEIVAIYEDVTAQKQAEESVWLEKERAQVTLHSIGDAVITTDILGNIDYLNPVAQKLTGWSDAAAHGLPLLTVFNVVNDLTNVVPENPVEKCMNLNQSVKGTDHIRLIHRAGNTIEIENSAAPICDRHGKTIGAILVFRDVSDKQNLVRELSHQAQHDALTGLPNRLLFNDRLSQALTHARRNNLKIAIVFLDLDHFKIINDTLGHNVGDLLLQAVSKRLQRHLREGDTIARQGGDEFLILLPDLLDNADAAIIAKKILHSFAEPFTLDEHEVFITPSIGISLYPSDGDTLETLVKHADAAMYRTKELGRNSYQFYDSVAEGP